KPAATPPPPPASDEPPTSGKPSEFRKWGQRQHDRAQKAEQELSKLKAKVTELESGSGNGKPASALAEELATTKKRLDEYESQARLTNFERSAEYREKYERPY